MIYYDRNMSLKAQQKIESKARILNVASRLFKKNGFAATGIDQVMSEAGLTAGAFYAHFKSKNDLLQQALQHSVKNSQQNLFKNTDSFAVIMNRYVSIVHRDLPEKGCVLPALAAELTRTSDDSKNLISDYIQNWVNEIIPYLQGGKPEALKLISNAVGAILLSRMTRSDLSNEILNASQQKNLSGLEKN